MTLLDTDAVNRLRDSLERIDYRTDAILEAIGEVGQRGLGRNTTVAAQTSLGSRDDPLAATVRLWLLRSPVPVTQLSALPLDDLVTAGIVAVEDDWARAAIDIRPYDSPDDGATGRVVATDINPRALAMAELSLALSGVETTDGSAVALREGSLYDPVDQRFDLIVSNPPHVMSPPRSDAERLVYREAGFAGDGLVEAVLRGAPGRLNPGGTAQILANWAQIGDQPWQDRLTDWVAGAGCDLWAVEREHLDVHEYIETWLTDAGLDGSAQWRPRYQEWLDYFGELGISGVSMGWLTLTAAGRDTPDLSFEEWPWAIQQPVGEAVGARAEGVEDSLLGDEDLLAGHWQVREDVVAESTGRPGAADPEHIVYRQRSGLRRAMEVDTLLGGVLGACDGEMALGTIVSAVARILAVDPSAAAAQTLGPVRTALREGILERS